MAYDQLSKRTRTFRKGTLTFSTFLILIILFNVEVTSIPALGINDLNPNIIFTANFIGLVYLAFSFLIYYYQDAAHKLKSERLLETHNIHVERLEKLITFVEARVDEILDSVENTSGRQKFQNAKRLLTRVIITDQIDDRQSLKTMQRILETNGVKLKPKDQEYRALASLVAEGRNNIAESKFELMIRTRNQIMDKLASSWDFLLPILSAGMAMVLYLLQIGME